MGRYQVGERLGQGGMGVVYRARQQPLEREVAIKFVLALDVESQRRFRREWTILSEIRHPNVVRLLDAGTHGDHVFYVMELLEAFDVASLLALEPFTVEASVSILDEVLDALDYLHGHGFVHRDIKPGNIMVDRTGRAVVMDFGLVGGHQLTAITEDGVLVGTAAYLAPELLVGEPATAATDLWSLGVTAYQMFTGKLPFPATNQRDLWDEIMRAEPPPPGTVRRGLPRGVDEFVLRLLRKAPGGRFATAALAREALRRVSAPSRQNSAGLRFPAEGRATRPGPLTERFVTSAPVASGQPPRPPGLDSTPRQPRPLVSGLVDRVSTDTLRTGARPMGSTVFVAAITGLACTLGIAAWRPSTDGGTAPHPSPTSPATESPWLAAVARLLETVSSTPVRINAWKAPLLFGQAEGPVVLPGPQLVSAVRFVPGRGRSLASLGSAKLERERDGTFALRCEDNRPGLFWLNTVSEHAGRHADDFRWGNENLPNVSAATPVHDTADPVLATFAVNGLAGSPIRSDLASPMESRPWLELYQIVYRNGLPQDDDARKQLDKLFPRADDPFRVPAIFFLDTVKAEVSDHLFRFYDADDPTKTDSDKLRSFKGVLGALGPTLSKFPDRWELWYEAGHALRRANQPDSARLAIALSLTRWPASPHSWYELALVERDVGESLRQQDPERASRQKLLAIHFLEMCIAAQDRGAAQEWPLPPPDPRDILRYLRTGSRFQKRRSDR